MAGTVTLLLVITGVLLLSWYDRKREKQEVTNLKKTKQETLNRSDWHHVLKNVKHHVHEEKVVNLQTYKEKIGRK